MSGATFLSGASIISCLGSKIDDVAAAIAMGRSGLTRRHPFAASSSAVLGPAKLNGGSTTAELKGIISRMVEELAVETELFSRYDRKRIGSFFGSTTAGVEGFQASVEKANAAGEHPIEFLGYDAQLSWIQHHLRASYPIAGPTGNIVTSCSAGALALAHGYNLVKHGVLDACIAGGLDLLTEKTIQGFHSLQILAQAACEPFAGTVNGINLADGGALVVIEKDPISQPRLKLLGFDHRSEAFHMTQPHPNGKIMARTMDQAISKAGLSAAEIDYISCHGTGTFSNDDNEKQAIDTIFGETVYFESIKSAIGHSLAGSGPLELCLAASLAGRRVAAKKPKLLKNAFGFGGSNVCWVAEVV